MENNSKYRKMAEEGIEYHIIREEAVKDGLEGDELKWVMRMVDNTLMKKEVSKVSSSSGTVSFFIGLFFVLVGAGVSIYTMMNGQSGVIWYGAIVFGLMIMFLGKRAL